jgi:hypothetical protein
MNVAKEFFMNKKLIFAVMLVGLLAFVTVWAFAQNSPNVRWEYQFITVTSESEAKSQSDVLGREGWELVSGSIKGGMNDKFLSFKRRLP